MCLTNRSTDMQHRQTTRFERCVPRIVVILLRRDPTPIRHSSETRSSLLLLLV